MLKYNFYNNLFLTLGSKNNLKLSLRKRLFEFHFISAGP